MENKKISFGFSKISKPTLLPTKEKKQEENKIELIKCMEGNEIKLVEEKKEKPPMVIPMTENRTTSSALASLMKRRAVLLGEDEVEEKAETKPASDKTVVNGNGNVMESLEQRAVRELLAEVSAAKDSDAPSDRKLVLQPLKPDELPLDGAKESTFDDYENIPIQEYGLALLRGMGWIEPPKKKSVSGQIEDTPVLRPKGMGLGADKALKKKPVLIPPDANEKLEIKKQAYVCILGGKHKHAYGQIEGFDDEQGRVIVRMAIGGTKESFNEFLCQPVSRKEFAEYGKCINTVKYEQYKRQENEYGQIIKKEKKIYVKEENHKESKYEDRERNKFDKSKSDNYREEKNKQSYNDNWQNERKIKDERDYSSSSYSRNGKTEKYHKEQSESSENSDSSYEHRSRKEKKKHRKKDEKYRESSSSQKHKESSHKKKTKKSKKGKSRSRSPSRHRR